MTQMAADAVSFICAIGVICGSLFFPPDPPVAAFR
jgi:hypothetical protein